ncbi:MAG: hypothetical protein AB1798_06850 [Spirochaetota bacterium]
MGATVYAVDGHYPGLFGEHVSLPPQILRHRPDAIGVKADGQVCIGEAKTENDIENKRTYEQLQDFSTAELRGRICEVFIGIPQPAEDLFNRTLERWGLKESQNIHVLFVPDEIIND